ncbi:hypothetical protein [Coxiella-like endosymbiont]|uniref:hypothetical protein n=1 Tax=Coxiella-like endosymbiont TaxID=1592897 RepID=UPI00272DAF52|nr:hypothetical protein [Coxiella-like endosymbiont]
MLQFTEKFINYKSSKKLDKVKLNQLNTFLENAVAFIKAALGNYFSDGLYNDIFNIVDPNYLKILVVKWLDHKKILEALRTSLQRYLDENLNTKVYKNIKDALESLKDQFEY